MKPNYLAEVVAWIVCMGFLLLFLALMIRVAMWILGV